MDHGPRGSRPRETSAGKGGASGSGGTGRTAVLVLSLFLLPGTLPAGASAQGPPTEPGLVLGVGGGVGTAAASSVTTRDWTGGGTAMARVGWNRRGSGVWLLVDAPLFQVDRRQDSPGYQAYFVLPAVRARGERFHVQVGGGVSLHRFDEAGTAGSEVGWDGGIALGATVGLELPGPFSLEADWRRGDSGRGFNTQLISLGLLASGTVWRP